MNAVTPFPQEAVVPSVRVPPHNYDAEQALLGAILRHNPAYHKVSEFLKPEHFADPAHGTVYRICGELIEQGRMADGVTLKTLVDGDPTLGPLGGLAYLGRLVNSFVTIINAEDYGKLIVKLYKHRAFIAFLTDAAEEAFAGTADVDALQETLEGDLQKLAETGIAGDRAAIHIGQIVDEALADTEAAQARAGAIPGITTGLADLDEAMDGFEPGIVYYLGARPSMGKTAMGINAFARGAARAGIPVGVFELEMKDKQLARRLLSSDARVRLSDMKRGRNVDWHALNDAAGALRSLPIYIDDQAGLTMAQIRARARRMVRKHKIGLLIIDHLTLIAGGEGTQRVHQVGSNARLIKVLAKELGIPIVVLAQLSRALEAREDKRPQLSDLRDSGEIEEHADTVMFLFREQYYLERSEPGRRPDESDDKFNGRYDAWQRRLQEVQGIAEVGVAKGRDSGTGTVKLFFDGQYVTFGDLTQGDQFGNRLL